MQWFRAALRRISANAKTLTAVLGQGGTHELCMTRFGSCQLIRRKRGGWLSASVTSLYYQPLLIGRTIYVVKHEGCSK